MFFDLIGHLLVFFLEKLVEPLFDNSFHDYLVLVFSAVCPVPVLIGKDVKTRICVKISLGEILGIKSLRQRTDKVIDASRTFVGSASLEVQIQSRSDRSDDRELPVLEHVEGIFTGLISRDHEFLSDAAARKLVSVNHDLIRLFRHAARFKLEFVYVLRDRKKPDSIRTCIISDKSGTVNGISAFHHAVRSFREFLYVFALESDRRKKLEIEHRIFICVTVDRMDK